MRPGTAGTAALTGSNRMGFFVVVVAAAATTARATW